MENEKDIEAQRQKEMDEYIESECFEYTKAAIKGEGMPYDPFDGTTPADVRERRRAREQYAVEDFEPVYDPVENYFGPRSGSEVRTVEELNGFVLYQANVCREKYPDDFDEVITKYVLPKLKGVNQQELQQAALEHDDFVEVFYRWGKELADQHENALPQGFRSMSFDDLTDWLNARYHSGNSGGVREPEKSPFITRSEKKRMNRMTNPADFERALDEIKRRGQ